MKHGKVKTFLDNELMPNQSIFIDKTDIQLRLTKNIPKDLIEYICIVLDGKKNEAWDNSKDFQRNMSFNYIIGSGKAISFPIYEHHKHGLSPVKIGFTWFVKKNSKGNAVNYLKINTFISISELGDVVKYMGYLDNIIKYNILIAKNLHLVEKIQGLALHV